MLQMQFVLQLPNVERPVLTYRLELRMFTSPEGEAGGNWMVRGRLQKQG